MGRTKKEVELTTKLESETISTSNIVELTSNTTEETVTEVKIESTLHDKYRKYILQANSNYCRATYPELVEMLRFVENKIGHSMGLNLQCSSCIIELVKLFARLENK